MSIVSQYTNMNPVKVFIVDREADENKEEKKNTLPRKSITSVFEVKTSGSQKAFYAY